VRTRLGFARVGGSGPPLVCVHGLAVSSRYFVPLAQRLAARHRVVVPDLPGYGKSPTPPEALGIEALADALTAWLDLLDVERAPLVANSLGCQVAVDLGVRRPDRVSALVLLGPTMDPAAPTLAAQAWNLARDVVRESPVLNLVQARDYLRMGPRRILATARYGLDDRFEAKLARLEQPALVIRGEHDRICSQPWAERVAELARGRLAVVPGAAHVAHWSAPDVVARLVEEVAYG
jgi:pimeloyl-ACP methyl ester carboxylesterase